MINSDDARRIAAAKAAERGWPFYEPVQIRRKVPWFFGKPRWTVLSHAAHIGSNVRIEIDDATGAVVACAFNLR